MNVSFTEKFKGTERFKILKKLGIGGYGVVYQAYDKEHDMVVALKTFHQKEAESLYRFKQEFRSLTDITHPNLVTLYELFSDEEKCFFTMELVDGVPLFNYIYEQEVRFGSTVYDGSTTKQNFNASPTEQPVEASPPVTKSATGSINPPLVNMDRLRFTFQQLAKGVFALHQAGKLHRDLKPTNVLVTQDNRVVILDFGLVIELSLQSAEPSKEVIGTPEYMSPEHAVGLPLTPASDWYSVGVMLYQALTGRLPIDNAFGDLLVEKATVEPIPPRQLLATIPEDLDRLCQELLHINPNQRPSGEAILQCFGLAQDSSFKNVRTSKPVQQVSLVGREDHFAVLNRAFQSMCRGATVVVNLSGRSGIGKSSLIRHFLEEYQQPGSSVIVLAGRCYEQESVPYKAFDSVIDALSHYLSSLSFEEVSAFLPEDILALVRLFPVLRQVDAITGGQWRELDILDSQELRRHAFAVLRDLFSRLAIQHPLIIAIDDLQWGDLDSSLLINELLRPPAAPPLMLLLSYRSEDAHDSAVLKTIRTTQTNYQANIIIHELEVKELTAAEAKRLITTLIGEDRAITPEQMESIVQESTGNPFFIDELIYYSNMGLTDLKPNINNLATETKLAEVIQMRIAQLSEEAIRLLRIVAVAGQPIERSVAKRAAHLNTEEQAAIALLRTNHLIRVSGYREYDKVETYHDRIRETVVAHLSLDTLKLTHRELALALEATGRADPEMLASHFQGSGDDEKAAKYVLIAAEGAWNSLAFERAVRLYQQAVRLKADESPQALNPLRIKLGNALANCGQGQAAAQAYLQAAQYSLAAETMELQQRAAEQLLRGGHIDKALAILRKVLANVDTKLAATPWQALLSLLYHRLRIRLRGLKFQERDTSQLSAAELVRLDIYWSVAMGLGMVDTIRGMDFQSRYILLALKAGEPYRIARAFSWEIAISSLGGGRTHKRTETYIKASTQLAEKLNNSHIQGLVMLARGGAAFMEGRFRSSRDLLVQAERIFRERCHGVAWEIDTVHLFHSRALIMLGELAEMGRRLPEILKEAQEHGDLYAEINLRTRISYMQWLASDKPEKARRELDQSIARWSHQGFHAQHFFTFIGRVEIELYCGKGDQAWQLVNEKWPELERSLLLEVQLLKMEAIFLRGRAALAAALLLDDTKAKPLLRQAEKESYRLDKEDMPWGNALAALLRAGINSKQAEKNTLHTMLADVERRLHDADMMLYAMAVRRRRGALLANNQGAALIREADDWMYTQKINNPVRMTAMLAPGKWSNP